MTLSTHTQICHRSSTSNSMALEIVQKPVKMSFSIATLSQSSCTDVSKNEDAVIVSRHQYPVRQQRELTPVSRLPMEQSVTPIKLQARVQPVTSTPIPLPRTATPNWQNKRKRDSIYSDDSSNGSPAQSPGSSIDEHDDRPSKKSRPMFTNRQIIELERYFLKHNYLLIEDRPVLAQRLSLSETQIKTWFQNRRMKEKRQKVSGPSRYMQKKNELCESTQTTAVSPLTQASSSYPTPKELSSLDSYQPYASSKIVHDQLSYLYSYGAIPSVMFSSPSSIPYNGLSPRPADHGRL